MKCIFCKEHEAHDMFACPSCIAQISKGLKCEYCGKITPLNEIVIFGNTVLCPECFDKIKTCSNCGDIVKVHAHQIGDKFICHNCFTNVRPEEIILNKYNYRPETFNFISTHAKETLFLGIELEMACNRNDILKKMQLKLEQLGISDKFYFKHDGSIRDSSRDYSSGIELVSMPISLAAFHKTNFRKVLEEAYNLKCTSASNGTCGIHVHLSRKSFEKGDILKLTYFFQNNYKEILKFSRRTEEQLHRWSRFDSYDLDTLKKIYKNDHTMSSMSAKYHAINLKNRDTIEIRIFNGTLDYNTLLSILQFCESLYLYIKESSFMSMKWSSFIDWVYKKGIYNYLLDYCYYRGLSEVYSSKKITFEERAE